MFACDIDESGGVYLGRCVVCRESCTTRDDVGEMHDPRLYDGSLTAEEVMVLEESASSGLVHAQCGLDKGWVVS